MALFNILVDIAAKTASFEEGMKRAEERLTKFAEFAKSGLELAGLGVGLHELADSFEKAAQRGDELVSLADRMKTTTESLTQLGYAAKLSDVSFETLTGALDTMSKNIGMAADGTGRTQKIFELLRISAQELVGLSLDQQFTLIANKIAGLASSTERTQVAMQVFGGEGAKLVPILEQGGDGIERLREEADKLGVTIGSDVAKSLAQSDDAIKKMNASWDALTTNLIAKTAPAINGIITALRQLTGSISEEESIDIKIRALQAHLQALLETHSPNAFEEIKRVDAALEQLENRKMRLTANNEPLIPEVTISPALLESYAKNKKLLDDIDKETQKRNDAVDAATAELQKQFGDRYAEMNKNTMTAVERDIAAFHEREDGIKALLDAGLIDEAEAANRTAELWDEAFKEVSVSARKVPEVTRKTMTEIQQIGAEGARGLQRDFADFLFDPMGDGFDGLVKAFANTLRKMAADAAASDVFKWINGAVSANSGSSSLGSFFANLLGSSGSSGTTDWSAVKSFGGGKAGGGPLDSGKWYIAGEHGPEPIWGGGAGAFAMGYGSSGPVVINTTNVFPVTRDVSQQTLTLWAQSVSDATISRISEARRRGSMR